MDKGGDLFIVDNSSSGWTAEKYLHDWCDVATGMDIASGFFEIGALLALDGQWQKLDRIRILMGDEVTRRTRQAFLDAIKKTATEKLDQSLEQEKDPDSSIKRDPNPFLNGAAAIVQALADRKIECRVYNQKRFHAKAYITHAKLEVVGSKALVGSSNFTLPGLTQNIELNIQVQSGREVAQLQEWYEEHWDEAEDITEDILRVISRHTQEFTPFDVYTRALQCLLRNHAMTAGEWDRTDSIIFDQLDRYQQEGYWKLIEIARRYGGAFLCDGVGLGKTFVGLMLIERLVIHERKRVVLFAPKGAKEGVWVPHLRKYLSHIQAGSAEAGAAFSSLYLASHTDFSRKDFAETARSLKDFADVVIIDEGHHFRNRGRKGNEETGVNPSRYWQLYDLLEKGDHGKQIYFLTATPVNNDLSDFRHMIELFSRGEEAYFGRTLGVNGLTSHFISLDKAIRKSIKQQDSPLSEHPDEVRQQLVTDKVFDALVVQRSRRYVRESQELQDGEKAIFPVREKPVVAEYSVRKTYGALLDQFEKAFRKTNPLFALSLYYPMAYYIGDDEELDPFDENRQKQVVGLIRTNFLKRFESSVRAFELSLDRLMRKLLAFLEVHCETDDERERLASWQKAHADILSYASSQQREIWGLDGDPEEQGEEEPIVPEEYLDQFEKKAVSREEYDVPAIIEEVYSDLDQIISFLNEAKKFKPKDDDKLKKLIHLLKKSKELDGQKVLIFSEFADTVRYLQDQLEKEKIEGVDFVDGGVQDRLKAVKRFAPYYNSSSSGDLQDEGLTETRILISSDVLSEGLNLQDACFLINYDIHWNPVRLMQRIGRVDRRLNREVEEALKKDHPEIAKNRGRAKYWNFLPPDEIKRLLSLYQKVTQKTLLISETLGIETGRLLTPEDQYNETKVLNQFQEDLDGRKTVEEELRLELQQLLDKDEDLGARLESFPAGVFSGRKKLADGLVGVFFCYTLPAWDTEIENYSLESGPTRWYFYELASETILEDISAIVNRIRSKKRDRRFCDMSQPTLIEIRKKIRKHIKDTYEKQIDLPLNDVPRPRLECWMELNDG